MMWERGRPPSAQDELPLVNYITLLNLIFVKPFQMTNIIWEVSAEVTFTVPSPLLSPLRPPPRKPSPADQWADQSSACVCPPPKHIRNPRDPAPKPPDSAPAGRGRCSIKTAHALLATSRSRIKSTAKESQNQLREVNQRKKRSREKGLIRCF